MYRAVAFATIIVLGVVVAATAWVHRDLIRIRIASTSVPVPPKAGDAQSPPPGGGGDAFRGVAPWALSALPDCLIQDSIATGSLAYVRSKLPTGATIVASGSTLHFGPCTIFLRGDEVLVRRGADRLVIPPHVTLYRTARGLALLRKRDGQWEMRVYDPPSPSE